MMRSLYSGVAGLKNHQTRMDVTGNNIANVNTVGYKAGRTTFQDMLSQSIKGAASPTGNAGGVNPLQIGLGMGVASVDNIFTTGSLQATGKNTDLAIDGDGFFMVKSGLDTYYTRAGNFDFDSLGNYVIPGTGLQVMGWLADENGNIDTSTESVPLNIPLNSAMPPKATSLIRCDGNLNSTLLVNEVVTTSKDVYDSMGVEHQANMSFTKLDDYTWQVEIDVEGTAGGPYVGAVVFDAEGKYLYDTFSGGTAASTIATVSNTDPANPIFATPSNTMPTPPTLTPANTTVGNINTDISYTIPVLNIVDSTGVTYTYTPGTPNQYTSSSTPPIVYEEVAGVFQTNPGGAVMPDVQMYYTYNTITTTTINPTVACTFTPTNGAADMTIGLNLLEVSQYGNDSNKVEAIEQDGYTAGTLERASLSVSASGIIFGKFSNSQLMNLGQVSMAIFTNPGGLTKVGSSLFAQSNNSGTARVGIPGQGSYGAIKPSNLEMSNVDLSEEFTTMITTQRGFQANSRIITTSDTMLEELVNLKR